MKARIDHVVLWTADPLVALDFYERVVGLTPLRADEFREGKVFFPSVRVSDDQILDLMARAAAPMVNAMAGGDAAGHPVNHVCFSMSEADFEALRARLEANGVVTAKMMETSFGARGFAPKAFYFLDPDGNVLEARYY